MPGDPDLREGRSAAEIGALGVIAGGGVLPRLVAEAERGRGGRVFVIALRGHAESWVESWPHRRVGVGQAGRIFTALKTADCRRVCFAGGLSRPSMFGLRFDLTALRVAPRVARLMRRGDDGLLRGLAEIFESRGFRLVGPNQLLGECLAPAGPVSRRRPSRLDMRDITRAAEIVQAIGAVDVGQAAIVAHGRCLGVETVQGTDALLRGLFGQKRRGGAPTPSGVLYKAPKPGQDHRLDLPAIGPRTIEGLRSAGLNGVAIEAGAVFVLDIEETLAAADRAGVFVYGWDRAGEGRS